MQSATPDIDYKALYDQAQLQIIALQHQLSQLQKLVYGSKTEKFIPAGNHTSQLALNIQAEEVADVKITSAQKIAYTRVVKEVTPHAIVHPGRGKLPEHLERREQIINPPDNIEGSCFNL
jgi:transposase